MTVFAPAVFFIVLEWWRGEEGYQAFPRAAQTLELAELSVA